MHVETMYKYKRILFRRIWAVLLSPNPLPVKKKEKVKFYKVKIFFLKKKKKHWISHLAIAGGARQCLSFKVKSTRSPMSPLKMALSTPSKIEFRLGGFIQTKQWWCASIGPCKQTKREMVCINWTISAVYNLFLLRISG